MPSYVQYHKKRETQGGGIAIFVKSDLQPSRQTTLTDDDVIKL